jgi:hypothetical protein
VVIGMGQLVGSFRWDQAIVEIRLIPVEVFVRCVPTNLRSPQIKSAFICFAGPGIELLLALMVLLFVGTEQLFSRSDNYWTITWQSLALAATAQAVVNLIPGFGIAYVVGMVMCLAAPQGKESMVAALSCLAGIVCFICVTVALDVTTRAPQFQGFETMPMFFRLAAMAVSLTCRLGSHGHRNRADVAGTFIGPPHLI